MIGVTKAEIERQVALGEVSRLAVAHVQHAASSRERDGDLCTEPVAVRARAAQPDLEKVDGMSLRQIADQHLRPRIELVGHEVEIAVPIQIERDRRSGPERTHHGQLAGAVQPTFHLQRLRMGAGLAQGMAGVGTAALEREPDLLGGLAGPWLDPHHELARQEAPASVVEQHGVDPVPVGEVHPRGDEDIVPSVGVEIVHAGAPGPVRFHPDGIGDLLESAAAAVREQLVAEQESGLPLREHAAGHP